MSASSGGFSLANAFNALGIVVMFSTKLCSVSHVTEDVCELPGARSCCLQTVFSLRVKVTKPVVSQVPTPIFEFLLQARGRRASDPQSERDEGPFKKK